MQATMHCAEIVLYVTMNKINFIQIIVFIRRDLPDPWKWRSKVVILSVVDQNLGLKDEMFIFLKWNSIVFILEKK